VGEKEEKEPNKKSRKEERYECDKKTVAQYGARRIQTYS
jgi:hypothetical protein